MTNSQRLAIVRSHLVRWLSENLGGETPRSEPLGGTPEPPTPERPAPEHAAPEQSAVEQAAVEQTAAELSENAESQGRIVSESILIRDGFYGGRTFHASAGARKIRATWFMEPDELKIRDERGEVLAVFQGDDIQAIPEVDHVDAGDATQEEDQPVSLPIQSPMPSPQFRRDDRTSDGENGDGAVRLPKAA